jgi:hypothetical protein
MSALNKLRQAFPELQNASDSELVGEVSKRTGTSVEDVSTAFGVAPRGTASEVARQFGAGLAVDLPRMVGQGLKYTGIAPETGEAMVQSADERAPGWQPDMRGRGFLGQAVVAGGRGLGPVAASVPLFFVPGGQVAAPLALGGLFGTSSAQDTFEKVLEQTGDEQAASAAARRVGLLQGAGEAAASFVGARTVMPLVRGLTGAKTTGQVADRLTDTRVLAPFARAYATNLAVQSGTEAAQDVGTEYIERAYGAVPEDAGQIAAESAKAGFGMALLLGPFNFGGSAIRARRSEELKQALYGEQVDPQVRAQAMDAVLAEARRQNIAPENVDAWFEQQLQIEDARTEALREAEERANIEALANRDKTLAQMVSEEGLTAQLSDQDLLTPGRTSAQAINQAVGLTRKKVDPKKYVKGFESAFNEPSGQFGADPETGVERELTVGELYQLQNGVLDLTQDKPGQTAVAEAAATKTLRDPRAMFMRDTLGIVPNQYSMQLLDAIEQAGIPLDSDMVSPVITFAANGTLGKKGLTRALQMLDEAVINSRRAAAPVVSEVPGVSESAGVSPTAAPAVVGLSRGGQVAPTTTQAPVAPAAAPVAPTAAAQIGQAPSAPATPAPVTQEGTPSGITTPQAQQTETQGQAAPAAAPAVTAEDGYANDAEAWDDFRPDGAPEFDALAPSLKQAWGVARQQGAMSMDIAQQITEENGGAAQATDPRVELIAQLFDGKNATRNAEMFIDRVVMGMSLENLGKKYGLSTSGVSKVVGGEKDAAARMQAAMGRAQARGVNVEAVQEALRGLATEAQTRGELDIQNMFGDVDATAAEAAQADLGTSASSVGGSGANTGARLSDVEKRTFAILEALAKERSPQKRAELEKELAALVQDAKAEERKIQETIRATAGKQSDKEAQAEQEQTAAMTAPELGAEDAVQEQGAAGVPVQPEAEAGQKVGRQVRRAEKPAAEGQAQTEAKVLTTQERYAEVTAGVPGAPAFGSLTKAQQDQLADLNNGGNLNLAAVNNLLSEPASAEVDSGVMEQGPEVPAPQEQVLEDAIQDLPDAQITRLEQHYDAPRGSAEFLAKVRDDVVLYVNKGAEAVAGAIRSIIKSISEGVLAVGVVFNPGINLSHYSFDLPSAYSQTMDVRAQVPAEAAGSMSELAKSVYERMAPVAQKSGKAFIIADKPNGMIHAFDADGTVIAQDTALYGKDKGDVLDGKSSLTGAGAKITPAGKFSLKVQKDDKYTGGYTITMPQTVQFEGDGVIAVHAAYLGNKVEDRQGRLATKGADDKRISYGCINTSHDTFLNKLLPNIGKFDGGMSFVLPDNAELTDVLFEGETQTVTRTGDKAKGDSARTVAAKEEGTAPTERILAGQRSSMLYGKDGVARNPYTAKELLAEIKDFIRADIPSRKLLVVDSIKDLLTSTDRDVQIVGANIALNQAYGVAADGRAYLIANRINKGSGRAKFMHEVGAHLGLENLLSKQSYNKLTQQILDWAKKDDGSTESQLAKDAAARVMSAGTPKEDQRSELLAYFIEEAMESGIDPTAAGKESGPLRDWFRTLWAAFKVAARRLGVKPESMTSQDVVNLAFGAARLEIAGTWHGTAAAFRNFSNKFMGTGEGAQAFGWGTYLAQRAGIAKGYWKADVKRKTTKRKLKQDAETFNRAVKWSVDELMSDGIFDTIEEVERFANILEEASGKPMPEWAYSAGKTPEGSLMRVDVSVPENEMLDWDTPLSEQPSVLTKIESNLSEDLREAVEEEVNESIGFMTGEDFYRALTFIEKRDGFVSEQFDVEDYNKRLANTPAKQVVSTFIDEKLGINGLKFLDANSRASTGELAVVGRRLAASKKYLNELTSDEFEKVDPVTDLEMTPAQVQKAIADTQETIKQLESEVARLKSEETRNIVVFDDKNIFRVGAEAGADRQRMKFGKNATEGVNQATRAQPRGTVMNNINRLPKQVQQPANIIAGTLSDTGGKFLDKVMFTSDLVKRATNLGLKSADNLLRSLSARDFATREEERAIEAVLDLYADVPQAERGTGDGSVNRFIFDSTRTGKWGYGPKADPEMKARFNLLSEKSQKLVEAMFTHGDRMLARKKSVVIDNTTSVFDAQIAAAKTDKEKAELRTAKKLSLKRYESLFAITEGRPYAPIKRNGNYVVVAKSPKYLAAEATGDTKALEKLQASGDDYHVSFVDGKNAGRTLMQQLQDQGGFGDVQLAERDTVTDELFSNEGALQQLSKLRTNVDNRVKAGEKESGPLLNIINQMYLDALAEGSARKSEMKRRGVDGEVDMIASFGTQGRADANFLASLQYSEQVSRDLNRMREEAKTGDRTRKSEVLNELVRRYSDSLDVPNTPILDKLTRMSSVYFLATSPAYYLQNLTQPFMMSVPAMAGEHNYAKVNTELFKAYGELAPMMKSASLMKQLDFTKVPDDVKNAINQLVNRGRVDIGIDTELGEFKVDGESRFGAAWNSVDKGLRAAVQKGEAINRLSTAIAAYRLAMSKKGTTADQAIDYAERILLETHGDYSRFNAPRAFNTSFGRIALQFRKFQLIQLTWYAKMIKQAYSDPAQRGAALRSLAFGLTHTGVLAGAMGLPGYAAVAWALGSLFGDDDEAFDLTDEIRKLIGDDDLANMVLRGVPTLGGADVSGKIGAGNMLSIMPFSNADLTTRAGFYEGLGTLVAGASGGMVVRGVDGLGLLANGDYLKGMELMLPKGLGDMIKAYRLGVDGATRRNNDVILPADELDSMEVLFQALGIPPAQITAMYEKQERVRNVEQRFRDRTSRLKNNYSQAIRKGDSAAAAEARADWMKLQEARVRAGLKRQPLSNLLKAPREQTKRERETAGGVQFTRASRGMVEDIVER